MRKVRQRSSSTAIRQFISARVPSLGDYVNTDNNNQDTSGGDRSIPVIVNREADDDDENTVENEPENVSLPSVDQFTFDSIISHVQPESDSLIEAVLSSVREYRKDLTSELQTATQNQGELTQQMAYVDNLAVQTLRNTQNRTRKAEAQLHNLKGIDELAKAAEDTYETLTNILFLLNDIDDMLPIRERLRPIDSPHKVHYPDLHELMRAPKPILSHDDNDNNTNDNDNNSRRNVIKPRRSVSLSALHSNKRNEHNLSNPPMNLRSIPPQPSDNVNPLSPATVQGLPMSESESESINTMIEGNLNTHDGSEIGAYSGQNSANSNAVRSFTSFFNTRKTSDNHELQSAQSRLRRIMES